MPAKPFLFAVLLAVTTSLSAAQEPKKKSDDNNRTITVTGCVDKGYLHVRAVDAAGSYTERYRLRGSKQLLKEVADTFNKHVLEVTGVVTDLTRGTVHRGKTIDVGKKTRITTGAKEIPAVPVAGSDVTLEVASFRELANTCG